MCSGKSFELRYIFAKMNRLLRKKSQIIPVHFWFRFWFQKSCRQRKVWNFWYNFQNFWPFFRLIFDRNRQFPRCFRIIFDIFKNFGQNYTGIFGNISKMSKVSIVPVLTFANIWTVESREIFWKILLDHQNTGKPEIPEKSKGRKFPANALP